MTDIGTVLAVIYAAKSTSDEHHSIPNQVADDECMCAERDWTVIGTFDKDVGFSAYKGNRGPDLEAAIRCAAEAAARTGQPVMLVAQHSDRFARGAGDSPGAARHLAELWFETRRLNVHLHSVQDDHNLEDALRAVLIGERNTEDSQRKEKAIRDGHRLRAGDGEVHGKRNFGHSIIANRFDKRGRPITERVENEEETVWLRRGWESVAKAEMPIHRFVQHVLRANGVKTTHGGEWRASSWTQALENRIYSGYLPSGAFTDKVPLIFPEDSDLYRGFWAARAKLGEQSGRGKGREQDRSWNLLTKHTPLRCGFCDAPMVVNWSRAGGKPDTNYRCSTNVINGAGTCPMPTLRRREVDEPLLDHLLCLYVDFTASADVLSRAASIETGSVEAELTQARKAASRAEKAVDRVDSLLGDEAENLTVVEWREQRAKFAAAAAVAHDRVTELEAYLASLRNVPRTRDGEAALLAIMDAMRAAVTGLRVDGDDLRRDAIRAVRVALSRLFVSVTATWSAEGGLGLKFNVRPEIVKPFLRHDTDTADEPMVVRGTMIPVGAEIVSSLK